jgi:hypothetical protein
MGEKKCVLIKMYFDVKFLLYPMLRIWLMK